MNETELSAAIAFGQIGSPQPCGGFSLFAIRVTGTGTVWREARGELAFRPPDEYLTSTFLQRVQGLPVVADHPEGMGLDSAEFEQRSIGTCVYPYIATPDGIQADDGTEVWSVARIYSDEAVAAMSTLQLSTSPAVIWRKGGEGERVTLPDGSLMLMENSPVILDHLAVCELGVFDRGGPPVGVRFDSEDVSMTDEEKTEAARKDAEAKTEKSSMDKVLEHLSGISSRMDAMEKRLADNVAPPSDPDASEARMTRAESRKDTSAPATNRYEQQRKTEAELHEIQGRADTAYISWGLRAAAPMQSESPITYRQRMLRGLQRHSPIFKSADLNVLAADPNLFAVAETTIYADAMKASKNPCDEGRSIKRVVVDPDTGHRITTYHGGETIFKLLSQPTQRVTAFRKPANHEAAWG